MLNIHTTLFGINFKSLFSYALFSSLIVYAVHVNADFEAAISANQKGDRATAFREFQAAAFERDPRAYGKLASMYLYGLGTEKNYTRAYVWFDMACLAGDRYAERFRDSASAMMTRTEYLHAMELADQQRIELAPGMKSGSETKAKNK